MTVDILRKGLSDGVKAVFAKRLNAEHRVRGCFALEFERRKGYHVVEQSLKQIRRSIESENGVFFLILKDDKIQTVAPFGDSPVTELPPEMEEDVFQKLPRYDFTMQVQIQRLQKKIGFF